MPAFHAVRAGSLALALALAVAGTAGAAETPPSFAPVAKKLLPAVVNIATTRQVEAEGQNPMGQLPPGHPLREFFERFGGGQGQQPRQVRALGSGLIIDGEEGYIVTNHHVVGDSGDVRVILDDDTELEAEIVGTDQRTDIAVLDVDPGRTLPEVEWGNSTKAEVGDWTLAIGNPFGLGGTATAGIVSARGRDIDAGPYRRFIQTDASINQGSSGGPLFNAQGKVIGINTAILSPSGGNVGVGFALPSRVAQPIVEELIEDGKVTRGWLGVSIQPVTPGIAEGLGLGKDTNGALVASVAQGTPADEAGLQQGDVVTAVEGEPIEDAGALAWRISQRDPGETVTLTVLRDGERQEVSAELGNLEEADVASAGSGQAPAEGAEDSLAAKALGLKLAQVGPKAREHFDLPENARGAVVAAVAPGGPAAAQGIRPGDIIKQIGRETVSSPEDVNAALAQLAEAGSDGVLLLVQRGEESQYVPVPMVTGQTG